MSSDNFLLITADNVVAEGDATTGAIWKLESFDTPSKALEFARAYCCKEVVEYGIELTDDNFDEEKRMRDASLDIIPDETWEEGWG